MARSIRDEMRKIDLGVKQKKKNAKAGVGGKEGRRRMTEKEI